MKLLITGSTGFIGAHFLKACLARHISCVALVRPSTELSVLEANAVPTITFSGDVDQLRADIVASGCTGVVHFASLFLAQHQSHSVAELIQSNVLFGAQLVEACVGTSIAWFVTTGTVWQNYNNSITYNPINLYAATKQAFLDIVAYYRETTPIIFTEMVLGDTYGPNDPRKKLINLLLSLGETPLSMSPGEQVLELTYIDDVVSGYVHLVLDLQAGNRERHNGRRYRIGSGETQALKTVVQTVEKVLGRSLPVMWGALPYRPREMMVPWQGGDRLPGWTPQFSLKEGLLKMVNDGN